ncbi:MAG: response regulator transcription factor [Bacilli bacterium]|nr:response regulator transcription factor [Bacilli bacterium]
MYNICLVEDEKDLSNLIKTYLEKSNYNVIQLTNGTDALSYIGNKVDLWILDIMLGDDVNGYDIIKAIREVDKQIPVIFTSARDQELDKIIGLELGSDDYITKPYSPKELVLRINNIIKRVYREKDSNVINYMDYMIDSDKRIVFNNQKEVQLTTLEFDLLELLVKNIGKSFSRDDILNLVWGSDYFGSDRAVDDLVRRIRKKLPNLNITTIYGFGYRLS